MKNESITHNGLCRNCGKPFDKKEVERIYGKFSSVLILGFCSAQCYTLNQVKTQKPF